MDGLTTASRAEYVYLIGCEENALVKIGRSNDVKIRLAEIQRMSPVRLEVLWQAEGGFELESRLHRTFRYCRSHGEWFSFVGVDPVAMVKAGLASGPLDDASLPDDGDFTFKYGQIVWIVARGWTGPPVGVVRDLSTDWGGVNHYGVGGVGGVGHRDELRYSFKASELRPFPFPLAGLIREPAGTWPRPADCRGRSYSGRPRVEDAHPGLRLFGGDLRL